MEQALQALAAQLTDTAVRHTASGIADRIRTAKARKQDRETIAELEDIISDLIADKNELVQVAQAFQNELVAQRISADDIQYLSNHLVPTLLRLAEGAAEEQGQDVESLKRMVAALRPLISVETVTILQLLGFNFKKAIGEPLTDLVGRLISSRAVANSQQNQENVALSLKLQMAAIDLAGDPEAYARFRAAFSLTSGPGPSDD